MSVLKSYILRGIDRLQRIVNAFGSHFNSIQFNSIQFNCWIESVPTKGVLRWKHSRIAEFHETNVVFQRHPDLFTTPEIVAPLLLFTMTIITYSTLVVTIRHIPTGNTWLGSSSYAVNNQKRKWLTYLEQE